MEKNLYIDASHPNETRVVLKSKDNIEDYEYEGSKNNLIKNNIYLGKVSRIEPSLQAAFVDFGRERHGFLSFNDIQSDYYQIPQSDLEKIKQEEEKLREELSKKVEEKEEEQYDIVEHIYLFNMYGSLGHKVYPHNNASKLEIFIPYNWEALAKEIDFKWYKNQIKSLIKLQ